MPPPRVRAAASSRARPVAWCDGGIRGERAAAAFVLNSAAGRVIAQDVRLVSPGTIEDVECAAVAAALERAVEPRSQELEVRLDSQTVVDWLTAKRRPSASRQGLRLVTAQRGSSATSRSLGTARRSPMSTAWSGRR